MPLATTCPSLRWTAAKVAVGVPRPQEKVGFDFEAGVLAQTELGFLGMRGMEEKRSSHVLQTK